MGIRGRITRVLGLAFDRCRSTSLGGEEAHPSEIVRVTTGPLSPQLPEALDTGEPDTGLRNGLLTHWELTAMSEEQPDVLADEVVASAARFQEHFGHEKQKILALLDDECLFHARVSHQRLSCLLSAHIQDWDSLVQCMPPEARSYLEATRSELIREQTDLLRNRDLVNMNEKVEALHHSFEFFGIDSLIDSYRDALHAAHCDDRGYPSRGCDGFARVASGRASLYSRSGSAWGKGKSHAFPATSRWHFSFRRKSSKMSADIPTGNQNQWVEQSGKGLRVGYRTEANGSVSVHVRSKLKCHMTRIMAVVGETDLHGLWVPFLKRATLLGTVSKASQVVQHVADYPWPVRQKETIIYAFGIDALEELGAMFISIKSPDPAATEIAGVPIPPVQKKAPRIPFNELCYIMMPVDDGAATKMQIFANVHPGVNIRILAGILSWMLRRMVRIFIQKLIRLCEDFERTPYPEKVRQRPEFYEWLEKRLSRWQREYQHTRVSKSVLDRQLGSLDSFEWDIEIEGEPKI